VHNDFLSTIWISRLSNYLRPHLVGQTGILLYQQASIADAIVDISSNKKTQISQNLTSNYFKKGDLDELETKLNLKLNLSTKIQFQLQEQLNEIKKSIENITNSK